MQLNCIVIDLIRLNMVLFLLLLCCVVLSSCSLSCDVKLEICGFAVVVVVAVAVA